MNKFPFSAYDFFGYISSGFLLISAWMYFVKNQLNFADDLMTNFIFIVIAYILGHIVAMPSKFLLEDLVVGKLLKKPNINLFKENRKKWQSFFPEYYKSLPKEQIDKILSTSKNYQIDKPGEALFIHAFVKIKMIEDVNIRLKSFLNLYGFCRNISFSFFLVFLLILYLYIKSSDKNLLIWASLTFFSFIAMFYRYLKFYRLYSFEIFINYAERLNREVQNGD